jgi:hypothetical protein
MFFDESKKLCKQIAKYTDKHPTFEEDIIDLKMLLKKHFDQNDIFEFSPKMLTVDKNIKYRTVYKILGISVQGLSKKQSPRLWFKLESGKIIFLLYMADHIENYKESECVNKVTQILKEMEL